VLKHGAPYSVKEAAIDILSARSVATSCTLIQQTSAWTRSTATKTRFTPAHRKKGGPDSVEIQKVQAVVRWRPSLAQRMLYSAACLCQQPNTHCQHCGTGNCCTQAMDTWVLRQKAPHKRAWQVRCATSQLPAVCCQAQRFRQTACKPWLQLLSSRMQHRHIKACTSTSVLRLMPTLGHSIQSNLTYNEEKLCKR
jgi:hypothetical protein